MSNLFNNLPDKLQDIWFDLIWVIFDTEWSQRQAECHPEGFLVGGSETEESGERWGAKVYQPKRRYGAGQAGEEEGASTNCIYIWFEI